GAPRHIAAREIHPALRHFQAAVSKRSILAETPPFAGEAVALAALAQVIEVELEKIMALDEVWIHLGKDRVESLQQRLFPCVAELFQHEKTIFAAAAQADCEHAILGLRGITETALRRRGLDVELATPQIAEMQVRVEARAMLHEE